jgi:hypothetical protein
LLEPAGQGHSNGLGKTDADEATRGHGVAIVNQLHGFIGRDELAAVRVGVQAGVGGNGCVGVHGGNRCMAQWRMASIDATS